MIKTVAREYKWPPEVLGGLYFDDQDYEGLVFWYNDVLEMIEKAKPKPKGKK